MTLEDSSEAAGGYPQDDVIKLEANGHVIVEDDPDDDDDEAPGKIYFCVIRTSLKPRPSRLARPPRPRPCLDFEE